MATGEYRSRMTPTRPAPASLWKRFAVGLLVTAVATLLAMTLVDPVLGVLVAAGGTVLAVASAFGTYLEVVPAEALSTAQANLDAAAAGPSGQVPIAEGESLPIEAPAAG